jgi:hypothetical protein
MAFARSCPIDAIDAQDDDRTSSELSLSDGKSCGSPARTNDCGNLPPLAVLKQYADGVATTREKTHRNLSLHKDPSIPRTIQTAGRTLATPVLGGRHYQYFRA